jgi:hypothetical protein
LRFIRTNEIGLTKFNMQSRSTLKDTLEQLHGSIAMSTADFLGGLAYFTLEVSFTSRQYSQIWRSNSRSLIKRMQQEKMIGNWGHTQF